MPDFKQLLSRPLNTVEKPKPLPSGTYFGTVGAFQLGESRDKKTPYVEFQITLQEAGPDVDAESLATAVGTPPDFSKKKKNLRSTFYLTEDSLYRLKEFLSGLGVEDGNGTRSFNEMLPETTGRPIMFEITQRQNKDKPDEVYNDVQNVVARPVA